MGRRVAAAPSARALLVLLLLAGVPAVVSAHVNLVATAPERNETISQPPNELRLRFSGTIEQRYTNIVLRAPDGRDVPVGAVSFVAGSDREFTVAVPRLAAPGTYTVQWRTAGADGHVLEGSYTFTLAGDTAAVAADPTADAVTADGVTADPVPAPTAHDHHEFGAEDPEVQPGLAAVAGRWLHFTALLLLLGAFAFRLFLLPRLSLDDVVRRDIVRRAWRVVAFAALLLGTAAVLRLWQQSVALHGADRAWSSPLLSMMLTDTNWGRAWLVQAFLFAVLGAGIVRARPGRDGSALIIAVPAVLGLATIPALTGHAAGVGRLATLVVMNDALHVIAAGAWLGMLAVVTFVLVPALVRHDATPVRSIAAAVDRFSPLALTAAAVLVTTGVINALMHISALRQLTGTGYGRALMVKLGLFALVLAAGFVNWRFVRPGLSVATDAKRLRISAGAELAFAAFVLLATAYLTGLARP